MSSNEKNEELKLRAEIELAKLEAKATAKEVTSKKIGSTAIPWIVLLVIVGVTASAFLPTESLPAIIGLVSTAAMALISMLSGITGTNDKEEKPEFKLLHELVERLDKQEDSMSVEVKDESVVVRKGDDVITTEK